MTLTAHTTAPAEQASCPDRVTQLLEEAAAHIQANGLHQGAYYGEAGTNGPVSLAGAIHIAAGHQPKPPYTFTYGYGLWPVEPDFETAIELVIEVLDQTWPERGQGDHLEDAESWQDTATVTEVLTVLEVAANLAAARHSRTIR
jgi:hypothetical protein